MVWTKTQTWATVCVHLSRKTVKGQRHSMTKKRETTKTKDLQCMKTPALASTTLTCSPSVSSHFTHCWVSLCTSCRQFNCCRRNHLLNFWSVREFLVEIHTAKTGLLRCCLYTTYGRHTIDHGHAPNCLNHMKIVEHVNVFLHFREHLLDDVVMPCSSLLSGWNYIDGSSRNFGASVNLTAGSTVIWALASASSRMRSIQQVCDELRPRFLSRGDTVDCVGFLLRHIFSYSATPAVLCDEFDRTGFPQTVHLRDLLCDHPFSTLNHRFFPWDKVHVLASIL